VEPNPYEAPRNRGEPEAQAPAALPLGYQAIAILLVSFLAAVVVWLFQ